MGKSKVCTAKRKHHHYVYLVGDSMKRYMIIEVNPHAKSYAEFAKFKGVAQDFMGRRLGPHTLDRISELEILTGLKSGHIKKLFVPDLSEEEKMLMDKLRIVDGL